MKRNVLLLALVGLMPMLAVAQDDMYFYTNGDADKVATPVKKIVPTAKAPTYYSGINKSDDEYNRRGKFRSYYQVIGKDSLGNEIVEYTKEGKDGRYQVTDTVYSNYIRYTTRDDDDFAYSRRMSRFDGYYGAYYDPWFASAFYDPFYYGSRWGWRSSFYDGWYDPWYSAYYGGWYGSPYYYSGWHRPYYGYYGWGGYPYYGYYYSRPYYRGVYTTYSGHTGTANHWRSGGSFGGATRSYSNSRSAFSTSRSSFGNNNSSFGTFGGHRGFFDNTRSNTPTYSQPSQQPSRSTFSGGSFGGASRSGFNGGSGGSFGGSSRSTFGGGKFGGHR